MRAVGVQNDKTVPAVLAFAVAGDFLPSVL